ncbi:MAG: hypothetical protein IKK53_01355 [Ruminiclostridium sp.]|nr:hypothetical protein [Ruminiclostridium sp.]
MEYFFAKLKYSIEKDPLTAIFTVVIIVLLLLAVWLYRHRTRDSRGPDLLEYKGYYKIAYSPTGYSITTRDNLFRTLDNFYYLRSEPFNIEVIIEDIAADNGKMYHAHAIVTAVLPEEMVNTVCSRYFGGGGTRNKTRNDSSAVINQILSEKKSPDFAKNNVSDSTSKQNLSTDELFAMALSKHDTMKYNSDRKHRKTHCDAEIDMDLTIAFSAVLKKLVTEKGGTMTEEELKKVFLGKAMLSAISYGHTVTAVPDFDIVEIAEKNEVKSDNGTYTT